jgi:bifunctional non-homologous end joining protein LigD
VRSCLIDGEAVACDDQGLAVFDRLRYRHADGSVFLYAFDLELDGQDLRREPLETRKETLASLLRGCQPGVRLNGHLEHDDGTIVFHHACALGCEGIVSKRLGSIYRSGRCAPTPRDALGLRRDCRWSDRPHPCAHGQRDAAG